MMLSGKLWISHFLNYVDSLLSLNDVIFNLEWDKRTQQYWRSAMKNLNHLSKTRSEFLTKKLIFCCDMTKKQLFVVWHTNYQYHVYSRVMSSSKLMLKKIWGKFYRSEN